MTVAPGNFYTQSVLLRGVAQSVARGVWDAEVGGSSPLTPTTSDQADDFGQSGTLNDALHP